MVETLKIIPVDKVIAFESYSDERAAKISDEIERTGKLKNPLLVHPLDDKYLILDDSSILGAIKTLELTHLPAQIAQPATLSIHAWQLIVEGWEKDDLAAFCRRFPRQVRAAESSSGMLEAGQAEVRFSNRSIFRLAFLSRSCLVRADMCAKLSGVLARAKSCYRIKLNYNDGPPFREFPGASAAVFPPIFSLADLGRIALRGRLLPRGLVRIDQPDRVLGIDYAVSILRESVPVEEKESFLHQLLLWRMATDRIAYYNGSVYMFNN